MQEDNRPVFLHTRSRGKMDWTNQPWHFPRLPVVGEYVALAFDGPWYQVQLVVHCNYPTADYIAEVYTVEVDHLEEMRGITQDVKSAIPVPITITGVQRKG